MMNSTDPPQRGEIWLTALGAARPGEPGKTRPALVITPSELLTGSDLDLVTIVPFSATVPATRLNPRVETDPKIHEPSVAVVRGVRSVARGRLVKRLSRVTDESQFKVDQALVVALGVVSPRG